ncbi:MAG: hypothetical protein U9Q27_01565 [Patescibacteria group bacterium]|nr:hypothetical protein [Patescibacteria group bacterium]
MSNKINKIINEIISELFDPNGGKLYQPPNLDPSVVKLFEDIDSFYNATLDDDYWTKIDVFPEYNNLNSNDNIKAIDFIIKKMKEKYPDKNWNEIEKPLRKKIQDGIT